MILFLFILKLEETRRQVQVLPGHVFQKSRSDNTRKHEGGDDGPRIK
jgi:hypothetical protein